MEDGRPQWNVRQAKDRRSKEFAGKNRRRPISPGAAWNCEILENTKCAVQCDPVYGLYFIKNMIENGKPEQWKRAEWRKPSGEEVKNQELWQQYQTLSERHEIAVRFSKHHDYVEN